MKTALTDRAVRIIIGLTTVLVASLLVVTCARAGDIVIFDCRPTKILMAISEKGESTGFFQRYEVKDGIGEGREILPKHLFRIKQARGGPELYYRGKLCIELEE